MSGSVWPRAIFGGAVTIAIGYAIMKATTPTDQQFYDALSPDLKRQVDAQRLAAQRKAAYAEQLKRAKEQDDTAPVWAEGAKYRDSTPPPKV
ncbi:Assembly factor CBP4 [Pseudozyma hubeiensis]|nr:Assembly factor CBP4 [Pseudozyma hubeiensis]